MEYLSDLASKLEPVAIGWLADLIHELEAALAVGTPSDDERSHLLNSLPQLRAGLGDWIGLLEAKASGEDTTDSVWLAVRQLSNNLPAKLEPALDPRPAGVLPEVPRDSVAGRILFARESRAMESDPFREAVSALGDADSATVARLAGVGRGNADRAIRSIDACLHVLASKSA